MKDNKKINQKNLSINGNPDQTREQQMADMRLEGVLNNTEIILTFNPNDSDDATETYLALKRKAERVTNGETKDMETILIAQAVALDSIFRKLSLRAYSNMGDYINAAEKYMRLAFKAQSQCRATLETLAEIKNPRPYIQNNRAEYQQVNNGAVRNSDTNTRAPAHAEKTFSTNELLEDKTHEQEWLDTRAQTETIRSD